MDEIKFIPLIVDYPSRMTFKIPTEKEKEMYKKTSDAMSDLIKKHNLHIVMNDYIYIRLWENGVPTNRSLRIKDGGTIYNKLTEMYGKLPQSIELKTAENLDSSEIH